MRQEFQPRTNACKDNNCVLVSDTAGVIRRWTEHFEELLGSVREASMEVSEDEEEAEAVSYTHLDVYKRQVHFSPYHL